MRKTTPIIVLFIAAVLMAACGRRSSKAAALLARADSLMTAHPDSAYRLLDSIRNEARTSWRRADRMRYELTLAEAMNKAYKDFTTDSVLKQVVRYYDSRGSYNDQLKARYLLGCAYRDMGEAPAAINAWQEAVDCADTTSTDCDYNTLYRVYGQMADVYNIQHMPKEELEAQQHVSKFALRAKDLYNYIRGIELQVNAYYLMDDSVGVSHATERARQLYLKNGMKAEAAQVYAAAIHMAIDKGLFRQADSLMGIYETESGLFDSDGNIEPFREQYYYYKGICYLNTGRMDSAECLFRRLLSVPENIMDAYLGLLKLYQRKENIDSAALYVQLYETALSDYLKNTHDEAVTQMKALYNYNRQAMAAQRMETRNAQQRFAFAVILFLIIMACIFIFFIGMRKKEHLKWKYKELTTSFKQALTALEEARLEADELKQSKAEVQDLKHIVKAKDEKVQQLSKEIGKLKTQIEKQQDLGRLLEGAKADIVKNFHDIAKKHKNRPARAANNEEWNQLIDMIRISYTDFYLFITIEQKLTVKEYQVCILSFLNFTPLEMSILTSSSKYISNVRNTLARKLFNEKTAYALNDHLNSFKKG